MRSTEDDAIAINRLDFAVGLERAKDVARQTTQKEQLLNLFGSLRVAEQSFEQ